jgi:glutamate-1-semialdehyde 2,1-aminomutase
MAPEGDVYQAGTLSGNPLAMAAGLATLKVLQASDIYQELERKGKMLFSGLKNEARSASLDVVVKRVGSMGSLFFTKGSVTDFTTVKACDVERFKRYYVSMLGQGIYLAPSAFETCFVSSAHHEKDILKTVECASKAFKAL